MSRRPRRNHSAAFKAKVALDAVKGDKTIAEMAQKHDVHPNQVTEWRRQLLERAADVFGAGGGTAGEAGQGALGTDRRRRTGAVDQPVPDWNGGGEAAGGLRRLRRSCS